jgi:hypothetical protein
MLVDTILGSIPIYPFLLIEETRLSSHLIGSIAFNGHMNYALAMLSSEETVFGGASLVTYKLDNAIAWLA